MMSAYAGVGYATVASAGRPVGVPPRVLGENLRDRRRDRQHGPDRRRRAHGAAAHALGRAHDRPALGALPGARRAPRPRPRARPVARHGARAGLRRRGDVAPASGPARPVGAVPRPGGGAGWLGPRARPAGLRLPVVPGARRGAHARRRPRADPPAVPWRRPRRLGRRGAPVPQLHAGHRLAHAARDGLRDGRPARRRRRHGRPDGRHGGRHVLRRRRDRAGRRQRGARLCGGQPGAARAVLPEQPVRDLGAQRASVPGAGRAPRRGLRRAGCARRRQRRSRELRGDAGGARAGTVGRWPEPRRGVHVPHGRAHDVGRPDALPHARARAAVA